MRPAMGLEDLLGASSGIKGKRGGGGVEEGEKKKKKKKKKGASLFV